MVVRNTIKNTLTSFYQRVTGAIDLCDPACSGASGYELVTTREGGEHFLLKPSTRRRKIQMHGVA